MFLYLNGSKEIFFFSPLISGGCLRIMISVDLLGGFGSFIEHCGIIIFPFYHFHDRCSLGEKLQSLNSILILNILLKGN